MTETGEGVKSCTSSATCVDVFRFDEDGNLLESEDQDYEVTDVDETITDDSIHSARRPSWRRTPTSRDSVHVSRASCRPESFADEFDALFSSPDEAIASPAGTGRCSPLRRYLHDADRLPPGYLRRASGKSPAKGEGDGLRI